jgi:hypothetical protein
MLYPLQRQPASGPYVSYTASGRAQGTIQTGNYGHIVVSVPGVQKGWFAQVNQPDPTSPDDLLFLVQGCNDDEIHVFCLNINHNQNIDETLNFLINDPTQS